MDTDRLSSTSSGGIADRLRQDGRERLESTKRSAAEQIQEVAHALDRAGAQLDQTQPRLAAYTNQFAHSVGNLATRLRDGSLDELMQDTRQLARRHPALFMAGGVAVGIALSRFLRASGEHAYGGGQSESYSGDYTGTSSIEESGEFSGTAGTYGASGPATLDPTLDRGADRTIDRSVPEPTADFDTSGYAPGAARPDLEQATPPGRAPDRSL